MKPEGKTLLTLIFVDGFESMEEEEEDDEDHYSVDVEMIDVEGSEEHTTPTQPLTQ